MKPFLILCILFSIYNCNDRNTSECKIAGVGVSSFSSRPATTTSATTASASTSLPYYTSEIKKDLTRSLLSPGNYAYVTLRAGCETNAVNQLDILDISDIKSPRLVKSYPMTNPFGLGIDNQYLFICDLQDGLMVYDIQNPSNISLLNRIQDTTPYDIILTNPKATLTGSGGVYQYNYTSISNITLISKIPKTLPPTSPL